MGRKLGFGRIEVKHVCTYTLRLLQLTVRAYIDNY